MLVARALLPIITVMATAADAPQVNMKAEELIHGRRAAYYLSGALVSEMQYSVGHGGDPTREVFAANAIANWARVLPSMFPPGTDVPPTHANPNVWTDRPGFEAKAGAYANAATRLAEVAATGDKDAFMAQLSATRAACDACHHVYHRQEEPSDGKK